MKKEYYITVIILSLLFFVSCRGTDGGSSGAGFFERPAPAELESRVAAAWKAYESGDATAAAETFAEIVSSGDDGFLARESESLGVCEGFGYSLLRCGRTDEALYQFVKGTASPESAVGAAGCYLARYDFGSCIKCFDAYPAIYTNEAALAKRFPVVSGDLNVEARKILFTALFLRNGPGDMDAAARVYSLIAEKTSEAGIGRAMDEIFLSSLKNYSK